MQVRTPINKAAFIFVVTELACSSSSSKIPHSCQATLQALLFTTALHI